MTEIKRTNDFIRTRCDKCKAIYETERKDYDFPEAFHCDCGEFIAMHVPAKPGAKLIKPQNADLLAYGDDALRLDTGMTAQEAIKRAAEWWEKTGRTEMRQQQLRQGEQVGGSNNGNGGAFASLDPNSHNHLASGIIQGKPWDQLDKRERGQLVKVWHHFHVRVPDLLGEEQAEFKVQERGKVQ